MHFVDLKPDPFLEYGQRSGVLSVLGGFIVSKLYQRYNIIREPFLGGITGQAFLSCGNTASIFYFVSINKAR